MTKHLELYKKYRPEKWEDLIGQTRTAESLKSAVKHGKIPTAYGFFGPRGCGKDLHKDTLIPTPTGFTTMGELSIGSKVLGTSGQVVTVTNKYCPMDPEIYEITFSDGTKVKAGSGHLWETHTVVKPARKNKVEWELPKNKTNFENLNEIVSKKEFMEAYNMHPITHKKLLKTSKAVSEIRDGIKFYNKHDLLFSLLQYSKKHSNEPKRNIVTTKQIAHTLLTPEWEYNHSVALMSKPANFKKNKNNQISPYILGLWLSAGKNNNGTVSVSKKHATEITNAVQKAGYELNIVDTTDNTANLLITHHNELIDSELKSIGVYGNKHLPENFIATTVKSRLALLAGLLDGAGKSNYNGEISLTLGDHELFKQVRVLIHSLGMKTSYETAKSVNQGNSFFQYTAKFKGTDLFNVSEHNRIALSGLEDENDNRRFIVSVEKIIDNPEDYYCISVDADDEMFLCTDAFIPTHNTSSAFIMAKAVNCEDSNGDGNPCNKCDTCLDIDDNAQMGVQYISMANKGSVDDVREIVQQARLKSVAKQQVWILDEVHNLSKPAFDALLIPIEELNMPSLFIFCSTEVDKIPATIMSRIQSRRFTLVAPDDMTVFIDKIMELEGITLDESLKLDAIRQGKGSVRDTLSALEAIVDTGEATVSVGGKLLTAMANRNLSEVLAVISEGHTEGFDGRDLAEDLFSDLRNLLLMVSGVDESLSGIVPVADPKVIAKGLLGSQGITLVAKEVADAITRMSIGSDSRIHLEIALVKSLSILNKLLKVLNAKN